MSMITFARMTTAESRGDIVYNLAKTSLGTVAVASTDKGICFMGFVNSEVAAINELNKRYPLAVLHQGEADVHKDALAILEGEERPLTLHVQGTDFQMKVWKALTEVRSGVTVSYSDLALEAGYLRAHMAVGSALRTNPVAVVIPCHRAIRLTGEIGNYRWGVKQKIMLLERERERLDENTIFAL